MPASSQTSPTSLMRSTGSLHCLAADRHAVDPRPAQLLQLVETLDRARLELRARADHVQVAARARIERQRQPVIATPRDVPVAHVVQPVVHALAHVLRRPLHFGVRVEHLLAEVAHRDEPVVGDAEDERRVAAPAVRVAVLVQARLDEEAALAEIADDLVGRLDGREPVQPAVVVVEAPGLVDGHEHGQVLALAQLEVLGARTRRDMDDPGALVE